MSSVGQFTLEALITDEKKAMTETTCFLAVAQSLVLTGDIPACQVRGWKEEAPPGQTPDYRVLVQLGDDEVPDPATVDVPGDMIISILRKTANFASEAERETQFKLVHVMRSFPEAAYAPTGSIPKNEVAGANNGTPAKTVSGAIVTPTWSKNLLGDVESWADHVHTGQSVENVLEKDVVRMASIATVKRRFESAYKDSPACTTCKGPKDVFLKDRAWTKSRASDGTDTVIDEHASTCMTETKPTHCTPQKDKDECLKMGCTFCDGNAVLEKCRWKPSDATCEKPRLWSNPHQSP